MNMEKMDKWKQALRRIGPLKRYHVGSEMDLAYNQLVEFYPDSELIEFRSGDRVGSWEVPPGWEVKVGRLIDPEGNIVCEFERNPLCLFSYSPPFEGSVSLEALMPHIFFDRDRPTVTPFHFRNQYRFWDPEWGFCLPYAVVKTLKQGLYRVEIDTVFYPSKMKMLKHRHNGSSDKTILFVGHFDHPAQVGDGLIGCLAGHELIESLKRSSTRYSYEMLSTVEMVGSVFFATRTDITQKCKEGLFLGLSGIDAPLVYVQSAKNSGYIDRIMEHVLNTNVNLDQIAEFRSMICNDENIFDNPAVKISCGSLVRWPYQHYHSDADTEDKILDQRFNAFLDVVKELINIIERNRCFILESDHLPCLAAPDLGLYISPPSLSKMTVTAEQIVAPLLPLLDESLHQLYFDNFSHLNRLMQRCLAHADGSLDVLGLAENLALPFELVDSYVELLESKGILRSFFENE